MLILLDVTNKLPTFKIVIPIYPLILPIFFLFIILQPGNIFVHLPMYFNGELAQFFGNGSKVCLDLLLNVELRSCWRTMSIQAKESAYVSWCSVCLDWGWVGLHTPQINQVTNFFPKVTTTLTSDTFLVLD